jgi:hypothetical protein
MCSTARSGPVQYLQSMIVQGEQICAHKDLQDAQINSLKIILKLTLIVHKCDEVHRMFTLCRPTNFFNIKRPLYFSDTVYSYFIRFLQQNSDFFSK